MHLAAREKRCPISPIYSNKVKRHFLNTPCNINILDSLWSFPPKRKEKKKKKSKCKKKRHPAGAGAKLSHTKNMIRHGKVTGKVSHGTAHGGLCGLCVTRNPEITAGCYSKRCATAETEFPRNCWVEGEGLCHAWGELQATVDPSLLTKIWFCGTSAESRRGCTTILFPTGMWGLQV